MPAVCVALGLLLHTAGFRYWSQVWQGLIPGPFVPARFGSLTFWQRIRMCLLNVTDILHLQFSFVWPDAFQVTQVVTIVCGRGHECGGSAI